MMTGASLCACWLCAMFTGPRVWSWAQPAAAINATTANHHMASFMGHPSHLGKADSGHLVSPAGEGLMVGLAGLHREIRIESRDPERFRDVQMPAQDAQQRDIGGPAIRRIR